MPHIPYIPRPRPGSPVVASSPPVVRSKAPLAIPPTPDMPDLPDMDGLAAGLAKPAPRDNRPEVPFGQVQRRGAKGCVILPTISMETFTITPEQAVAAMFPGNPRYERSTA